MTEAEHGTERAGRGAKRFLSVSAKYEIWLQLVRQEVTIAEAAATEHVDRSMIMRIRTVAKEGALAALAASKPGIKARQRDWELELSKAEVARLSETVKEMAVKLMLVEEKSVQDAAPVLLKTPARIEALFCCQFLALLISALLERQVRNSMRAAATTKIPLYPEFRGCPAPSTERILEIFANLTRHKLYQHGQHVQTFQPELSALQVQVLDLLGLPATAYTDTPAP